MGWTSGWASKAELIDYITRDIYTHGSGSKIIRRATVGNHLWLAIELTDDMVLDERVYPKGERYIVLYLLAGTFTAGHGGRWGFKDMTESMGPAYYTCPLAMLDAVPLPDSEDAVEWRKTIRKYHAEKQAAKELRKVHRQLGMQQVIPV